MKFLLLLIISSTLLASHSEIFCGGKKHEVPNKFLEKMKTNKCLDHANVIVQGSEVNLFVFFHKSYNLETNKDEAFIVKLTRSNGWEIVKKISNANFLDIFSNKCSEHLLGIKILDLFDGKSVKLGLFYDHPRVVIADIDLKIDVMSDFNEVYNGDDPSSFGTCVGYTPSEHTFSKMLNINEVNRVLYFLNYNELKNKIENTKISY